jgi:hypothetical protein
MWNWVVTGRDSLEVLSMTAAIEYTPVLCSAQNPNIAMGTV